MSSHDPAGLHAAAQEEMLRGQGTERGWGGVSKLHRADTAPGVWQKSASSRWTAPRGPGRQSLSRDLPLHSTPPRCAQDQSAQPQAASPVSRSRTSGALPIASPLESTDHSDRFCSPPPGPHSPLVPDLARARLPWGVCLALSTKNGASRQGLFSWWPGRARYMGTGATKSQGGCQDLWGSDHLQAHKTLEQV